jgi:hypothetical protein
MDFNFLPDMGRMIANLLLDAATGCLPDHFVPINVQPRS